MVLPTGVLVFLVGLAGCLLGVLAAAYFIHQRMQRSFDSLAGQALMNNNRAFLDLARVSLERFQVEAKGELAQRELAIEKLVDPLSQSLQQYQQHLLELERKREQAYGGLRQYLEQVAGGQAELNRQTSGLLQALRTSHVRGKWGEISLRRAVELAGLVEHVDFVTKPDIAGNGRQLRPDLIVRLPNHRHIIIDAKVPLESYLKAVAADGEAQKQLMSEHSRQLRRHISALGGKAYWNQLTESPDFVVLYMPLESLYSAALKENPEIFDEALRQKVVLATPSTLMALLKAVEHGWKQEKLARNAEEISELAGELYQRLATMSEHFARLGSSLDRSVQAYNATVGSLERRVLVQARKFKEMGISSDKEIPDIPWIERTVPETGCETNTEVEPQPAGVS